MLDTKNVNTSMAPNTSPKMDVKHFAELLRDVLPGVDETVYQEYIDQYNSGVSPELLLKTAQYEVNTRMNESKLSKQFILMVSENNYAGAQKVLEELMTLKISARVQQQLDEGLFDRLGAKAAGLGAGIKAKAQNIGKRVGSTAKAIGQNVVGAATGKGFAQGQATVDAANKAIAANDPRKKQKAAQADNLIASFTKDLSILYPGLNAAKLMKSLRTQINLTK